MSMVRKIDYGNGLLSESDINLIRKRANNNPNHREIIEEFYKHMPEDGYVLTSEQNDKGFKWLMNLFKTPKGKLRKDNPFGYREQKILLMFKEFRLRDIINFANYHQSQYGVRNYLANYTVIDKEGDSFDYYMMAGEIHITG